MKPDIHPEYVETTATCTCGATFTTRSNDEFLAEIAKNPGA